MTAVPISKTRKNALDFHLPFYIGYIASRNQASAMVVVANDNGYVPMLEHARAMGLAVRQLGHAAKPGTSAKAAPAAEAGASARPSTPVRAQPSRKEHRECPSGRRGPLPAAVLRCQVRDTPRARIRVTTRAISWESAWIGRTLRTAAWAPILVVLAYSLALIALGPDTPPWLDSIAHAGGGVAMTYFGFAALNHLQERVGETPRAVRLVAAVGLTAVAAIAWELLEFLVDLTARTRLAPSTEDTLLDLALGLAGAFAFALVAAVTRDPGASTS